jgi:hypothetical protein
MDLNLFCLARAGYSTRGDAGSAFVGFTSEESSARRGFTVKDLRSASADGSLQLSQENLLDDILILTRAGKLESGANPCL